MQICRQKKKKRRKGGSLQSFLKIKTFTNYGLETEKEEFLFYQVAPTNISVLSKANIEVKIRHLMMVLSQIPDIEIICTDSSECFDENLHYLAERIEREANENVKKLLEKDVRFLDQIQMEMATSRQFLFVMRLKGLKPEQVFQTANRIEKTLAEQGFEVSRMGKDDVKRFFAIYFDASRSGDLIPDVDGLQFLGKEGEDVL